MCAELGEGGTMWTLGILFMVTFYIRVLAYAGLNLKSILNDCLDHKRSGNDKNKVPQGPPKYDLRRCILNRKVNIMTQIRGSRQSPESRYLTGVLQV